MDVWEEAWLHPWQVRAIKQGPPGGRAWCIRDGREAAGEGERTVHLLGTHTSPR